MRISWNIKEINPLYLFINSIFQLQAAAEIVQIVT